MPWLALLAPLASLAFPVPPRLLVLPVPPRLLALLQVTKTNEEGVRKSAFFVFRDKLEQNTLPESFRRSTARPSRRKSNSQQKKHLLSFRQETLFLSNS